MAVYVLERRSAVAMAKAIAGPEDPAVARSSASYRYMMTHDCIFNAESFRNRHSAILCSIRAKYGDTSIQNALYCSRTLREADQDISFFFPHEQGNTHLDKEHRLMSFDTSKLGPDVSLSSMTWLEKHEREPMQQEEHEYGQLDSLETEHMDIEPSLGLRLLSEEYVAHLPGPVRQSVQNRLSALEQVMDAGGGHASCADSAVGAANSELFPAVSPHVEL